MSYALIGQTMAGVCGRPVEDDRQVRARIRAEYEEMPGMSLTLSQAARLFDLDLTRCARVLDALVVDGVLWTNGREFLRTESR